MMLKKSSFLFCLITLVIGCFCFTDFKNNNSNSNLIGVYVDDEYTSSIPSESSGYVVEKIICDNDAVGEWDYNNWGLLIKNMTKKSKCNVYFKKGIRLADTITLVDTTGKCPTVNEDGTINVTGAESENSLLCMAPDNYGESYYFRGNVQNNYVYFAGFYWRIVRINGDGSIRMIYDGTTTHENNDNSTDKIIGKSWFNISRDDNAYMGYMYGTPGSSTYEETHRNTNSSAVKDYIDTWYENNLKDTESERYLSDNIFCNDRSFADNNTGTGAGQSVTYYRWGNLLSSTNMKIILNCLLQNDAFTVDDTNMGNGKLKYAIALPTADEIALSGAYNNENTNYYLYNQGYNWTMSAGKLVENTSDNNLNISWHRTFHYLYGLNDFTAYSESGVKPVINLKAGSLISGDGSISNPYKIS
mgnify:CR=1 FL=1